MKKIKSVSTIINTFSDYISFDIHPYSKVLNFSMISNQVNMLYEYPYEITDAEPKKIISVRILKQLDLHNELPLPLDFQYHSMISVPTATLDSVINNHGNGSNLFMNIINDIEYFHIFVHEIETVSEIREQKLKELV